MSLFTQADKAGRDKVINHINSKYPNRYRMEVKVGEYDSTDIDVTGYTKSNEVWYTWECKDRCFPHTAFTGEWVIEDKKIAALRGNTDRKGYYVNTFSDGYMVIWDISGMSDEEIEGLPVKECTWKKTTVVDSGKEKKVKKLLPLSKAKIIEKMVC